MKRRLPLIALIAACLTVGGLHAARPTAATLAKAEIPVGFAVGSGDPPLGLDVQLVDGAVGTITVAGPDAANVRASGVVSDGEATLTIKHDLAVALKFDLYVSGDGQHFRYASSCAVTPGISSFELWQQPVRFFALGNPRVVDGNKIGCD